jgi:tetratricopeptide (TPR) repeat protein
MATDRGAEAIELGCEALAMADELELPELQIAARTTIGTARVSTGDAGGVDDLEESIRIATDVGSPEIVRAYLNLGSVVANLGDVRRSAELHARGRVAAERFGDPTRLRWFDAERLYSLYWTRRWDEALELVDELLEQIGEGAPHVAAFDAHLVRGWILLERGDLVGATGEADAALELGRSFEGPQLLYPALAFAARTRFEAGDSGGAADLVDELLEAWATTRATTLPSFWVGEVAFVLRSLGRGDELAAVSDGAPRTRWLDAALAVASGEDVVARRVFNEIGSRADEERLAAGGRSRARGV